MSLGTVLSAVVVNYLAKSPADDADIATVLGAVGTIFLQRDQNSLSPTKAPSRIAYFTTCLCAVLIFSFYSGVLTSFMTILPMPPGLQSFADVYEQVCFCTVQSEFTSVL